MSSLLVLYVKTRNEYQRNLHTFYGIIIEYKAFKTLKSEWWNITPSVEIEVHQWHNITMLVPTPKC